MPFRLFEKNFLKLDATQNVHNERDGAARFDLYRRFYGNARDVGRSRKTPRYAFSRAFPEFPGRYRPAPFRRR